MGGLRSALEVLLTDQSSASSSLFPCKFPRPERRQAEMPVQIEFEGNG